MDMVLSPACYIKRSGERMSETNTILTEYRSRRQFSNL
ncbi:hypothetical protein NT06LI_0968 [Listeria innocua FSL J1-023]|nr:hypothetical protein NT06LI_0968 [Listeria innocua FSL J1-023]